MGHGQRPLLRCGRIERARGFGIVDVVQARPRLDRAEELASTCCVELDDVIDARDEDPPTRRIEGDADWDTPEGLALMRAAMTS